ncbi:MAG TPA: hypothetical protein VIG64_01450, partial [Actinomycetota bacterium]
KRLYSVDHTPDASECKKDFCLTFGFYLKAGDLNRDGVRDTYVEQSTSWSSEKIRYLVTGRTGRPLHKGAGKAVPVLGAVDGRGDDVGVTRKLSGNRLRLSVADGLTLSKLWSATISGSGAGRFADSFTPYGAAFDHNGDRCADVLAGVRNGDAFTLFVLDGRDGSLVWKQAIQGTAGVRISSRGEVRSTCV